MSPPPHHHHPRNLFGKPPLFNCPLSSSSSSHTSLSQLISILPPLMLLLVLLHPSSVKSVYIERERDTLYFLFFFLPVLSYVHMQDPGADTSSISRKPSWYQKAINMASHWRGIIPRSQEITSTPRLWRSPTTKSSKELLSTTNLNNNNNPSKGNNKLRKCTSMRVATSFTRVCLCAPISSYNEVFRADFPPRRSNSYPRSSKTFLVPQERIVSPPNPARLSTEGRRSFFRGQSLNEDVLMRRFVLEEEAMMEVKRRTNQMEIIRRRSSVMMRRKKLGPSRLSQMAIAEVDHETAQY